jgi:two-component system, LuxR family, response regulator FixJ
MSGTIQGKDEREGLSGGHSPVRHIAIVDDDESVRRALVRLLAGCSFSVRTYPSGVEFLESLKSSAPDCLILDLQMPDMTGLEVLHQLVGAGFSFPVIVVTAQDELGTLSRCMLAGAAAFLTKPFLMEPLLQALAAALGVEAKSALQDK